MTIDQISKKKISISRKKKDTEKGNGRAENRNLKTKTCVETKGEERYGG